MSELERRISSLRNSLEQFNVRADIGLVLGSGLSGLAERMTAAIEIPYADLDGMPQSTAPGHRGALIVGELEGRQTAICSGRLHLYEGHSSVDAAMSVYLLYALGVGSVVLTNAAGALNPSFAPTDLMLIDDHINLMGADPTRGEESPEIGPRFTDMSRAYSTTLAAKAVAAATREGVALQRGVYAAVPGPSFETSAERRYYRSIGGDVVGMSTVLETIAARHCGMEVLAISVVTNMATGGPDQQPDTMEESI